jgi:hypothetical protein
LSGTQGTLDLLIQTSPAIVPAAATGSITTVAGAELVDAAATGSITTVAGSRLIDGQTFTLDDGVNAATVFEFDDDASVTGANVAVTFTGADTATDVRDAIITAVNGVGAGLAITASIGGTNVVALLNDVGGAFGNQTILESVIDTGFIVTGMSGGGQGFTLNDGINPPTVFEFDEDGTATGTSVAVPYTNGDSATDVRDAIITAVNGVGGGLAITASPGGSAVVTLTNDADGAFGNQTILENVSDSGFIISGMTGGAGPSPVRTVCYLTDDPVTPTNYLAVRVDATNRPYLELTDALGVTKALITPSYAAIGDAQPVTVRLTWDSKNAVDGTRFATFKVNRTAVTSGDWTTNPTAVWTAFQPSHLVLGASLGDDDFDGSVLAVQLSNVVSP